MSIFSERLKLLRKNKGELQEQAAMEIGITRTMLSNYERGAREPDLELVVRIAHHYGTTPNYLLGFPDSHSIASQAETTDSYQFSQICEKSIMLSPESKNDLLKYIDMLIIRDLFEENQQHRKELEEFRRNYSPGNKNS